MSDHEHSNEAPAYSTNGMPPEDDDIILQEKPTLPALNGPQPEKPKPPLSPDSQTSLISPDIQGAARYTGRTFWGTFIELPLFFTMLGYAFVMITTGNLIEYKICHVHLNRSEEACHNLSGDKILQEQVQHMATDYAMIKGYIENVPPIFFAIFLGPWSDRYGRKYATLLSLTGNVLSAAVCVIVACYDDMPAEYLFISYAFTGIGGGFVTLMLGVFSYVADVSSQAMRTVAIAKADLALGCALALGTLASGFVVGVWGFIPVYAISCGFSLIAFCYMVFVLEECVPPLPEEPGKQCRAVRDLFDISNVVSSLKMCTQWRENNKRTHLLLLIVCQCVLLLPYIGESSILLYYTEYKFDWVQSDLSTYSSVGIVVNIIGLIVLFRFFVRRFKVSDITCGLMGITAGIGKAAMMAFSWASWVMYAATCLACFQPISLPMIRAMISKVVSVDEQGRIFGLIVCFEAVVPLFASAMYTQTYNATREHFPGAVFLMTGALGIIPLACLIYMFVDNKMRATSGKERLIEKTEDNCINA